MDLSPLFADRIPRVTYFPSRWASYFILTMNTSPFDSFLCFCFHILIPRWVFFVLVFFARGGGGEERGGWLEERGVQEGGTPSQSAFKKTLLPPCLFHFSNIRFFTTINVTENTEDTRTPLSLGFTKNKTTRPSGCPLLHCSFGLLFFKGWGLGGVGGGSIRSRQPVT